MGVLVVLFLAMLPFTKATAMIHPFLTDLRSITYACGAQTDAQTIDEKGFSIVESVCDDLTNRLRALKIPTRRVALDALPPAVDPQKAFANHVWLRLELHPHPSEGAAGAVEIAVSGRWGTSFQARGVGEERASFAVHHAPYPRGNAATQILSATPLGSLVR